MKKLFILSMLLSSGFIVAAACEDDDDTESIPVYRASADTSARVALMNSSLEKLKNAIKQSDAISDEHKLVYISACSESMVRPKALDFYRLDERKAAILKSLNLSGHDRISIYEHVRSLEPIRTDYDMNPLFFWPRTIYRLRDLLDGAIDGKNEIFETTQAFIEQNPTFLEHSESTPGAACYDDDHEAPLVDLRRQKEWNPTRVALINSSLEKLKNAIKQSPLLSTKEKAAFTLMCLKNKLWTVRERTDPLSAEQAHVAKSLKLPEQERVTIYDHLQYLIRRARQTANYAYPLHAYRRIPCRELCRLHILSHLLQGQLSAGGIMFEVVQENVRRSAL